MEATVYKMSNLSMPTCDQGLWLLAYDLKSSRGLKVGEKDRSWLESMRVKIWMELRHTYKCSPVQQSLWLVRDKATMEQLKQQVEVWKKLYESRGYPVRLALLPLETDKEGYATFMDMELDFLLQWLQSVVKGLHQAIKNAKPVSSKQFRTMETKVKLLWEILDEDFGKHVRYKEAMDSVMIALDKLAEVKKFSATAVSNGDLVKKVEALGTKVEKEAV